MILKRIIAVVCAIVFVMGAAANDKDSLALVREKKAKFPTATKTQLKKENQELKSKLDSLKNELERYRMDLAVADSINNEILQRFLTVCLTYGMLTGLQTTAKTSRPLTWTRSNSNQMYLTRYTSRGSRR